MHKMIMKVCGKQFLPVIFIFFFICISLFLFHNTLVAGTAVPPSHETVNKHQAHSLNAVDAVIDLETTPEHISAHTPATLRFSLKKPDGQPLHGITVTHERILHVIIVSEDFSTFAHLHPEDFSAVTPEMIRDARFSVDYSFLKAGRYLIALDSAVHNLHFSKQFIVVAAGEPNMGAFRPDFSQKKTFGAYAVTIRTPEHIIAGQLITLNYSIEKDGKPVSDLEPYLAAPMHLAIIAADFSNFIHAHGEIPGSSSGHAVDHMHGADHNGFGPEIEAQITFPVKGIYQIFSEIKHRGKVIITSFMVRVE